MTILDYEFAKRTYQELRSKGMNQYDSIVELFKIELGRFEVTKAVEVVDGLSLPNDPP